MLFELFKPNVGSRRKYRKGLFGQVLSQCAIPTPYCSTLLSKISTLFYVYIDDSQNDLSISITLYFTKRNCELSSSTFLKDVILRCLFSGSFVYLSLLIIYRYYTESIIGIILLFASSIPLSALSFYYIMLTQSEKVYFKNQIQILFHKINHR